MADKIVDLRVKLNTHATTETLICQYEDASNYWSLDHVHGTGLQFTVVSSGITIVTLSGGEIADTLWHHVALCKVASAYGIYLDGTQVAFVSDADVAVISGPIRVGALSASNYTDGYIDEVRIQDNNDLASAPVVGLTDTITVPASPYGPPGVTIITSMPAISGFISALAPVFGDVVATNPSIAGDSTAFNLQPISGSITASIPLLSGDISGTVIVEGTITSSMPMLSGDLDALNYSPSVGTMVGQQPPLSGDIIAYNLSPGIGSIAVSNPSLTVSAEASYKYIASAMPILGGDLALDQDPYIKDITATNPSLGGTLYGSGFIQAEIPMFTGLFEISTPLVANITADIPSLLGIMYGAGFISAEIPSYSGSISGTIVCSAYISASNPQFSGFVGGTVNVVGSVDASIPMITGSITPKQDTIASIVATVPRLIGVIDAHRNIAAQLTALSPMISGSISARHSSNITATVDMPVITGYVNLINSYDDIILEHIRGAVR